MTTYFDPTSPSDRNLLPPGMRSDTELPNVAALCEADVLSYYTLDPPYFLYTNQLGLQGFFDASVGTGEDITNQSAPATAIVAQIRVYLRGYKVSAADPAVDPNLALALKRTIAEVIAWRLNQWKEIEPGVESATGTDAGAPKSKKFRATAEDRYPPDWTRWLYPYDSRPTLWGW